jgi:hypothetical protein
MLPKTLEHYCHLSILIPFCYLTVFVKNKNLGIEYSVQVIRPETAPLLVVFLILYESQSL